MSDKHKSEPLVTPADAAKLERLIALQQAAHLAAICGDSLGLDGKAGEPMAVIADALHDALSEINRASRESEGKSAVDPWYRVLHFQAVMAVSYVAESASRRRSAGIWNRAFERCSSAVNF